MKKTATKIKTDQILLRNREATIKAFEELAAFLGKMTIAKYNKASIREKYMNHMETALKSLRGAATFSEKSEKNLIKLKAYLKERIATVKKMDVKPKPKKAPAAKKKASLKKKKAIVKKKKK